MKEITVEGREGPEWERGQGGERGNMIRYWVGTLSEAPRASRMSIKYSLGEKVPLECTRDPGGERITSVNGRDRT